jgi:PAS domain S-box-containing protein
MDYKKILDSLPILVFVNASDAIQVIFYNKYWYDYTGLSPEHMQDGWSHIVHPEDLDRVKEIILTAASEKRPYQVEVRLKNGKTGQFNWFLSTCNPVFNDNNEIEAWIGTSVDIQHLKDGVQKSYDSYETAIQARLDKIRELEMELAIHRTERE